MIGIGITTRNREEIFFKTLERIRKFMPADAKLVVVDDNSDKRKKNLKIDEYFYFKERVGIARSKNKCLELLEDCDHIFLFDDDFYPVKKGWEKLYIETAKLIDCHHLCFTFDFGDPAEEIPQFKILNNVEISLLNDREQKMYAKNLEIHLEKMNKQNKKIKILEKQTRKNDMMYKAWKDYFRVTKRLNVEEAIEELRKAKIQNGLYNDHVVKIDSKVDTKKLVIKYHDHPNGVMMYITKKCLQTIGGFKTDRPMYGGEHGGYSHRAHNAGLTPHPYADANNSSTFFCKHSVTLTTESVVSLVEREINSEEASIKFSEEHRTFDFYNYKQFK